MVKHLEAVSIASQGVLQEIAKLAHLLYDAMLSLNSCIPTAD
jgi:hypothetical protein